MNNSIYYINNNFFTGIGFDNFFFHIIFCFFRGLQALIWYQVVELR